MIYVYVLPEHLSNGYCFGGPVPIVFGNVDWFSDPRDLGMVPNTPSSATLISMVTEEVKKKRYYNPLYRFLIVLRDCAFTIEKQ